jgi:site-specific DNA-methyltransferase (adenine-specific)/adenine-specific DNA-methyltransferase
MRDLLADDGSIFVHCDWRMSPFLRLVLDEIFERPNFRNEIYWYYYNKMPDTRKGVFPRSTDTILWYVKDRTKKYTFHPLEETRDKAVKQLKRIKVAGKMINARDESGNVLYQDRTERVVDNVWRLSMLQPADKTENLTYPTQKPESLLKRVIEAATNEGELVADFFSGSGTTLATAEKLGRKWIGSDLGKFAIHTTRKRMIGVQRELKAANRDYRAFEILNLGKYERQHYIGVNLSLREEDQRRQLQEREAAFTDLILRAYKAEATDGFTTFQGKKAGRLVAIGPVNLPVTRLYVEEVIGECRQKRLTRADILGFEFEMGLFPSVQEEAKAKGIDLAMKYIPRDVFDKRAIERDQVVFHDVAFIEVKPIIVGQTVAVQLTDFSVFYNQDSVDHASASLGNGKQKIVMERGQIIKVSKDKDGIVTRESLTKTWTDWIDYWSVDFDYESKREVIRVNKHWEQGTLEEPGSDQMDLSAYEEVWTGDYVFENEWQSFRTKKDRSLELTSTAKECLKGRRKIAIKVVDIFGNDTMKVIEVSV